MDGELDWKKIYKIAGVSAIAIVVIIPIQIIIFIIFPPPESSIGFIKLFHENWMLGLLSLDFLYYINNALLALVYLGLFAAMKEDDFSIMLIALIIGLIGIASYYASAVGIEMLAISKQYYQANLEEIKQQMLSVGHSLILRYKGTAFDVYYILNAISLILISTTMLHSKAFGKPAAIWGLVAGFFMVIPSTAGTLGLIFSLISLVPWMIFSIIIGRKLLKMARQ